MRTITKRMILALLGGGIAWQGILVLIDKNYYGFFAIFIGFVFFYKARFW